MYRLRMVATVLAALLASLQLVPAQVVALADQSPLESPPTPSTHEELTLEALGLGAMTTAELDSTIEVLFPPPGAPLANRRSSASWRYTTITTPVSTAMPNRAM